LFKSFFEDTIKGAGKEIGKQGVFLGIDCVAGGAIPLVNSIKKFI